MSRRLFLLALVFAALVGGTFAQGLSYGSAGGGGASIPGSADQVVTSDGAGAAQAAPLVVNDAGFTLTLNAAGANPNWEMEVLHGLLANDWSEWGPGKFQLRLNDSTRRYVIEDAFDDLDLNVLRYDSSEGPILSTGMEFRGDFFLATEDTAGTNPVKYGWVSPDATLYGLSLIGGTGGTPYSAGLMTEGALRLWVNYLGSNYLAGPHRFTGVLAPTLRLGITTQALGNGHSKVVVITDSDYTLPAIDTSTTYQGDGDGSTRSREFTIIRGDTTNPVAVIAAGSDVIYGQGSEVAGGAVTLTWLNGVASIDLTEKGAGVRIIESYRRVSSGPDVFEAAWYFEALGLGVEESP